MRLPLLCAAAIAAGSIAMPAAHADPEVVDVNVIVSDHFGATAYATSTKPGETFSPVSVTRIAVTDTGLVTNDTGTPTVADIPGSTTGTATYLISAHPAGQTNENFNFLAVVQCVRTDVTGMVCTPSVGLHTVVTIFSGIFDS